MTPTEDEVPVLHPPVLRATPILIVTYRNANDLISCLNALSVARSQPAFEIFICENGGQEAFCQLIQALTSEGGPCEGQVAKPDAVVSASFTTQLLLQLGHSRRSVPIHLGQASENLGYGGGVNAWLRPLLRISGWSAAWILNPDSQPAPDALLELSRYARKWRKGMVGSRLVPTADPHLVHSRGLRWSRLSATARSVDLRSLASFEPDPELTDRRLDSPSGASLYVTRSCIEQIGLMDEHYFLYFEDLEWGLRAKKREGVGYAHRSIVVHAGGTTIGSSYRPGQRSALAVYLECRNIIVFVRSCFPAWLPWTVVLQLARLCKEAPSLGRQNFTTALRGIVAGLTGEVGRPDRILKGHRPEQSNRP